MKKRKIKKKLRTANRVIRNLRLDVSSAEANAERLNGFLSDMSGDLMSALDERDGLAGRNTTLKRDIDVAREEISRLNVTADALRGKNEELASERDEALAEVERLKSRPAQTAGDSAAPAVSGAWPTAYEVSKVLVESGTAWCDVAPDERNGTKCLYQAEAVLALFEKALGRRNEDAQVPVAAEAPTDKLAELEAASASRGPDPTPEQRKAIDWWARRGAHDDVVRPLRTSEYATDRAAASLLDAFRQGIGK